MFFDKQLVHVMQWSPVVDYRALLKQECPVFVTLDCKHALLWPLLPELMSQMGKVLVSPNANATNKCRFCVLWDTSHKRPGWVRINRTDMSLRPSVVEETGNGLPKDTWSFHLRHYRLWISSVNRFSLK